MRYEDVTLPSRCVVGQRVKKLDLGTLGAGRYAKKEAAYWNKTNFSG